MKVTDIAKKVGKYVADNTKKIFNGYTYTGTYRPSRLIANNTLKASGELEGKVTSFAGRELSQAGFSRKEIAEQLRDLRRKHSIGGQGKGSIEENIIASREAMNREITSSNVEGISKESERLRAKYAARATTAETPDYDSMSFEEALDALGGNDAPKNLDFDKNSQINLKARARARELGIDKDKIIKLKGQQGKRATEEQLKAAYGNRTNPMKEEVNKTYNTLEEFEEDLGYNVDLASIESGSNPSKKERTWKMNHLKEKFQGNLIRRDNALAAIDESSHNITGKKLADITDDDIAKLDAKQKKLIEGLRKNRKGILDSFDESTKNMDYSFGTMDYVRAHGYDKAAVGVGVLGFAGSVAFGGHKSNAELYSNPF